MTATYTRREERTGTVTRVSGSSVTTGPGWEPPEVGVCADDWPTLTKVYPVAPRPKLTLVLGDVS